MLLISILMVNQRLLGTYVNRDTPTWPMQRSARGQNVPWYNHTIHKVVKMTLTSVCCVITCLLSIWLMLSSKYAKKAIFGHLMVKKYIFAIARQMDFSWCSRAQSVQDSLPLRNLYWLVRLGVQWDPAKLSTMNLFILHHAMLVNHQNTRC